MDQILLFGDSLTQRSFDPKLNGWGAALADLYMRRLDVVNRGYGGYNTAWCRILLPRILAASSAPIRLATIFLGANDAVLPGPNPQQHVQLNTYVENLRAIIQLLASRTDRIVLIAPPPVDVPAWAAHRAMQARDVDREFDVTRQYAAACVDLGAELGLPVVDLWSTIAGKDVRIFGAVPADDSWKRLFIDGLHFGAEGNSIVYDLVIKTILGRWPDLEPEQLRMAIPHFSELDLNDLDTSLQFRDVFPPA